MKNVFFVLLLFGLLLFGSHSYSCAKQNNGADSDTSIISRGYLDIIEKSDSIVWYILDPMSEDSTVLRMGSMGEILLCETDTLEERNNALKSTLTYPQSFSRNDMIKESTFLPDVAICFFSKNGVVTFSYSFYCDLCRFESDGKYIENDGEKIRKSIIQMACEVFPQDRYLRNIKRREK